MKTAFFSLPPPLGCNQSAAVGWLPPAGAESSRFYTHAESEKKRVFAASKKSVF